MKMKSRRPGERMPSPKLNQRVNQLTEAEFNDLEKMQGARGKAPAFWQLIVWHRGRHPYDPDAEKAAFPDHNLYGLRKVAWKYLEAAIAAMREGLPPELKAYQRLSAKLSAHDLHVAFSLLRSAKAIAGQRGYYGRLKLLLALEGRILRRLFESDTLRMERKRLQVEMEAAEKTWEFANWLEGIPVDAAFTHDPLQLLGQADARQRTLLQDWEKGKDMWNPQSFPLQLQYLHWLRMEHFAVLAGQLGKAQYWAEVTRKAHLQQGGLDTPNHALLLGRLAQYALEMRTKEALEEILKDYERVQGTSTVLHARHYLRWHMVLQLHHALDTGGAEDWKKAEQLLSLHPEIMDQPINDSPQWMLLVTLATWHLSNGANEKAQILMDRLYHLKEPKAPLLFHAQYRVAHLQLLFAEADNLSFKLFARNYERFFKKHLPGLDPALKVLTFLRKHHRNKNPIHIAASLANLLAQLQELRTDPSTTYPFWWGGFFRWANQFLGE
jgi:hypothetical protein